MKRTLFIFFTFIFPFAGKCQILDSLPPSEPSVILTVDVNLAFGPSAYSTWEPSVGVRLLKDEHISIGIGDIGIGYAKLVSGTRYAFMAGPVIDYSLPLTDRLSYFFIAGVTLQIRWGAGIGTLYGSIPYIGGGLEYLPEFGSIVTVTPFLKIEYVASDKYLRMPRILPATAITIAFGMGLHIYL